jgi:uncharacterized protein (DUF1499 family)
MIIEHPLFMPIIMVVGVLVNFMLVLFITRNFPPKKPASIGFKAGSLSLCGNKPNCVCSIDIRPNHLISPFNWEGSESGGITKIEALVDSFPRTRVISKSGNYLHAEFRTSIFGFVDDVEFLVDVDTKKIHIRSASRLGYSDLGANRSRVEKLRILFTQIAEN